MTVKRFWLQNSEICSLRMLVHCNALYCKLCIDLLVSRKRRCYFILWSP